MVHNIIDIYSAQDSLVHRIDPRTKILAVLAFILAVVTTPPTQWLGFLLFFAVISSVIMLSRVPVVHILKRSLVIFPFVILITLFVPFIQKGEMAGSYNVWQWEISIWHGGIIIVWNVVVKAWLSILSVIMLSSTTEFTSILKGLERLGTPKVMVMLISFMYRYIFTILNEALRMQRARECRDFGDKRLVQVKAVGNIIGALFIRSYERGERIYTAMLARGFDGGFRTLDQLRFSSLDALFGLSFLLVVAAIRVSASFIWG